MCSRFLYLFAGFLVTRVYAVYRSVVFALLSGLRRLLSAIVLCKYLQLYFFYTVVYSTVVVVLVKYEWSTTYSSNKKKYALDAFTSLEGDVELVDGSCNVPSFGCIVSSWASHRRPQASSVSSIWPDVPLIHINLRKRSCRPALQGTSVIVGSSLYERSTSTGCLCPFEGCQWHFLLSNAYSTSSSSVFVLFRPTGLCRAPPGKE